MVKFVWYHVKSRFYMVLLVLAIASVGRKAELIYVQGQSYSNLTDSWSAIFFAALNAPLKLLSAPFHPELAKMFSHVPVSLFFVVYAFVGSYVFGILKGMADVFWRRKVGYRAFQGLFWLLDAIPMFGLIVLLEIIRLIYQHPFIESAIVTGGGHSGGSSANMSCAGCGRI